MSPRLKKTLRVLGILFGLFLVLAVYGVWTLSTPSDIRPPSLIQTGITAQAETRGRELLAKAVAAHGGMERWQSLGTAEYLMRDEWDEGIMQYFNPWPGNNLLTRFQCIRGTFTSRVEILEGDHKGLVWGNQSWHTYRQDPGQTLVFEQVQAAQNLLPAIHYFFELPFRLATAPIVAYTGERTVGGVPYDTVFVTWQTPEPHPEHDQYLLFINRRTGLVDLSEWTFRGAMPSYVGYIRYRDYREVSGVQAPFQLIVLKKLESPDGDFNHVVRVEEARFDVVPREALLPNPSLPFIGDDKPAPKT